MTELAVENLQGVEIRGAMRPGFDAILTPAEVGTGYFDEVAKVISAGQSSTIALEDSTEAAQF